MECAWEDDYVEHLSGEGFVRGRSAPTVMLHDASVKAAAELIGLRSLAKDLGWNVGLQLKIDSSSAKAITSRLGAGKVRHLEVRFLWLQEVTRNKQLQVVKVRGKANPADVLTKPKSFREACELLSLVRVIDASRECDWHLTTFPTHSRWLNRATKQTCI